MFRFKVLFVLFLFFSSVFARGFEAIGQSQESKKDLSLPQSEETKTDSVEILSV